MIKTRGRGNAAVVREGEVKDRREQSGNRICGYMGIGR